MGKLRARIIAEQRQKQPISELERKYLKARGRWSKTFFSQEWIDLACARGAEMYNALFGVKGNGKP